MTTCFQTMRITVCGSHYKISRIGNIIYYRYSFSELHLYKPRRQDGMHLKVMQERDVIAKLLSSVGKVTAIAGVPQWLKKPNITPVFKKGRKEGLEKYQPVSLTSVPLKVKEQVIREAVWIVLDIVLESWSHSLVLHDFLCDVYKVRYPLAGISCTV